MWLSDCSWDYKGMGWGRPEGGSSLDINYSHCQISPSSKGCAGHRGGARRLQVQSMLILCGPVTSAGRTGTTSLMPAKEKSQAKLFFVIWSVSLVFIHFNSWDISRNVPREKYNNYSGQKTLKNKLKQMLSAYIFQRRDWASSHW